MKNLNQTPFAGAETLIKAQLKKIMGGNADAAFCTFTMTNGGLSIVTEFIENPVPSLGTIQQYAELLCEENPYCMGVTC